MEPLVLRRVLSESAAESSPSNSFCHEKGSFLGVANVDCLHANLRTAMLLLFIIIVTSLALEHSVRWIRRKITCPQLKKIVNRVFEEVMIMGFISMMIFALNTTGMLERIQIKGDALLTATERLHFSEFFHFIVFFTMLYFIAIVLLLLFIGTAVPKIVWGKRDASDDSASECSYDMDQDATISNDNTALDIVDARDEGCRDVSTTTTVTTPYIHGIRSSTRVRPRASSGMDLVQGSRAYSLLLQRYQNEGWCLRFNVVKQWHLWKSFEILAYNICQNRSGYLYKNPAEMERLFGVKAATATGARRAMRYDEFHKLCMRNMLHHISHLHWSAFFVLLAITVVPALYPNYDHWIFLGVGAILLIVNLIIFFKVLSILRGIVDDRLRVITSRDIKRRMGETEDGVERTHQIPSRPRRFRTVALGVRAVIRMQMSALCHRQLHYHDHRFWFSSPHFLLRLFHFATIGQAFYLVWFTLVEFQTVQSRNAPLYMIPTMLMFPILALCVITPLTMPSLVLVMSLTGIFVDLNASAESGHRLTQRETTAHIRLMRRSYLRSHYAARQGDFEAADSIASNNGRLTPTPTPIDVRSPSAVFLRIYDSPMAAVQAGKLPDPSTTPVIQSPASVHSHSHREGSSSSLRWPRSTTSDATATSQHDDQEQSQGETTLTAETGALIAYREQFYGLPKWSPRHPRSTGPDRAPRATTGEDNDNERAATDNFAYARVSSPSFRGYCSKYGGYPDD